MTLTRLIIFQSVESGNWLYFVLFWLNWIEKWVFWRLLNPESRISSSSASLGYISVDSNCAWSHVLHSRHLRLLLPHLSAKACCEGDGRLWADDGACSRYDWLWLISGEVTTSLIFCVLLRRQLRRDATFAKWTGPSSRLLLVSFSPKIQKTLLFQRQSHLRPSPPPSCRSTDADPILHRTRCSRRRSSQGPWNLREMNKMEIPALFLFSMGSMSQSRKRVPWWIRNVFLRGLVFLGSFSLTGRHNSYCSNPLFQRLIAGTSIIGLTGNFFFPPSLFGAL